MDIVEGPVSTGPSGSVLGENSFYRQTRGTRQGGCHVAKRRSDPRVAYPEVQIRDLVRIEGIVAAFAPRSISIQGKFVLSRKPRYQTSGSHCS